MLLDFFELKEIRKRARRELEEAHQRFEIADRDYFEKKKEVVRYFDKDDSDEVKEKVIE